MRKLTYNPKLTGERMNKVNEASPASNTSDVERVVIRDVWNRCDVCGKFISFNDFNAGAIRRVIDPVDEIYETLCIEHKDV